MSDLTHCPRKQKIILYIFFPILALFFSEQDDSRFVVAALPASLAGWLSGTQAHHAAQIRHRESICAVSCYRAPISFILSLFRGITNMLSTQRFRRAMCLLRHPPVSSAPAPVGSEPPWPAGSLHYLAPCNEWKTHIVAWRKKQLIH